VLGVTWNCRNRVHEELLERGACAFTVLEFGSATAETALLRYAISVHGQVW